MIDPSKNWAVAIVHGVGTTKPQELLSEVTSAIKASRPELVLEPYSTVHDSADSKVPPQYQRKGRLGNLSVRFATAQWSDVSVIREGIFGLLGGILVGGIGSGYFVEVATNQKSPFARIMGFLLRSMIYVLALAIIPITFFTMLFSASALIGHYMFPDNTGDDDPFWRVVITAAVSLAASLSISWGGIARVYPARKERPLGLPMFAILAAIAMICSVSLTLFRFKDNPRFIKSAEDMIAATAMWLGNATWAERIKGLEIVGTHLALLHWLQVVCAIVMVALTLIVLVMNVSIVLLRMYDKPTRRSLVFSTATVISIWMLFLFLLWPENLLTNSAMTLYSAGQHHSILAVTWSSVQGWFTLKALPPRDYFPLLWYEVAYLALVVFAVCLVIFLMAARLIWKMARSMSGPPKWTIGQTPTIFNSSWPRLILPNSYQLLLLFFMGVVSTLLLSHLTDTDERLFSALGLDNLMINYEVPHEFWAKADFVKLPVIVVFLAFLFVAHRIRNAVKLLLDVVNHFTAPNKGFPIRRRIAERLTQTLNHLLPDPFEKPNLVIIAHSQGTVITLDALLAEIWQKDLQYRASTLTILTFGSPITHVYQHYFHNYYDDFSKCEVLRRLSMDPRVNWLNCYRVDDYVGTYVDYSLGDFPMNVPLKAGGHTNYWQPDVFEALFKIGGMESVLRDANAFPVPKSA